MAPSDTCLHLLHSVSTGQLLLTSMSNLGRSGSKVMQVQLSLGLHAVILGTVFVLMLLVKVCKKRLCRLPSHVSTVNFVLKMLASLAP